MRGRARSRAVVRAWSVIRGREWWSCVVVRGRARSCVVMHGRSCVVVRGRSVIRGRARSCRSARFAASNAEAASTAVARTNDI